MSVVPFFNRSSTTFAARLASSARIIVFTGPIDAGAIDSERKPSAISASASIGRPAISPHSVSGTLCFSAALTRPFSARSGAGDSAS